jgi:basic amino acid/polyamine antiporter, APA family
MSASTELRREMGLVSAMAVIVGGVIGSGIFFKPWEIARALPNPLWIHLAWAVLGIVCLFGAFAYAELGCLFPEAGGQYAFLREGWGRFIAFLYGWCFFLVINTGTVAALAAVFAETIGNLTPLTRFQHDAIAVGMVLVLALVNHFGVSWGALVQNLSTFAKVAALSAIVAGGLLLGGSVERPPIPGSVPPPPVELMTGIATACIAIFWAYEGWYQLPFNAAELKNPRRDLPRGMIWGTLLVIGIYVAANFAYLRVVPFDEMRALPSKVDVPQTIVERIFGAAAGTWLAILLCISVFGAANPCMLSSPRAMYAMGKDGLLPHWFTKVHPKWGTPTAAIWTQAAWSVGLILLFTLTGDNEQFQDLTIYVIFAALIFYALTVAAVFRVRARLPHAERPYRCWGYPVTPAIFILVALGVDGYTLTDPGERHNALIGLGIIACGVPVYWLSARRRTAS